MRHNFKVHTSIVLKRKTLSQTIHDVEQRIQEILGNAPVNERVDAIIDYRSLSKLYERSTEVVGGVVKIRTGRQAHLFTEYVILVQTPKSDDGKEESSND